LFSAENELGRRVPFRRVRGCIKPPIPRGVDRRSYHNVSLGAWEPKGRKLAAFRSGQGVTKAAEGNCGLQDTSMFCAEHNLTFFGIVLTGAL